MLTLNVLGHVYVTEGGQTVPVSSKAAALLSYLALEGGPQHREHLAELLWDTPDALLNLRVELTRLKSRGLRLFPERQPMLMFGGATDLDDWLRAPDPLQEPRLIEWLARLRGPALSGLEDLGSASFRGWVDQQRGLIHDRIEERLAVLAARLDRLGQTQAVEVVRARAELLGLQLPAETAPARQTEPQFSWPEQEEALRGVLERAADTPQLVLLQGHSGTRRTLLRGVVRGTPWQAVQVQASSQMLLQAALLQHLAWLLPPGQRPPAFPPYSSPEAAPLHLAQRMTQAGTPLLIALHDVEGVPDWLLHLLLFLLDLPLPLTLVLTTTSPGRLAAVRQALAQVGWWRLHTLTLPPLSVRQVVQALADQEPGAPETGDASSTRYLRAARLVQCSEGMPLYVQALLERGEQRQGARLPGPVRDLLLAELPGLPAALHDHLARLAQILGRFDPALAGALLGEAAPDVLRAAEQVGLLVPASECEALTLPHLNYRSSDAETHLAFASELTRSALASTLPAAERHAVRAQLASLLLPTHPAQSLLYATRAHLPDLAAAARAALPSLPAPEARAAPAVLVGEPPGHSGNRREVRTPGGYRVALEGGWLEVLRRGHPGPPPLLILTLPGGPAGVPGLTARIDMADGGAVPGLIPPAFMLGLRAGGGPRVIYGPEPLPDVTLDGVPHVFGGVLPQGRWFQLGGPGGGGPLELSVRAVNVALTVVLPQGEGRGPGGPLIPT